MFKYVYLGSSKCGWRPTNQKGTHEKKKKGTSKERDRENNRTQDIKVERGPLGLKDPWGQGRGGDGGKSKRGTNHMQYTYINATGNFLHYKLIKRKIIL